MQAVLMQKPAISEFNSKILKSSFSGKRLQTHQLNLEKSFHNRKLPIQFLFKKTERDSGVPLVLKTSILNQKRKSSYSDGFGRIIFPSKYRSTTKNYIKFRITIVLFASEQGVIRSQTINNAHQTKICWPPLSQKKNVSYFYEFFSKTMFLFNLSRFSKKKSSFMDMK